MPAPDNADSEQTRVPRRNASLDIMAAGTTDLPLSLALERLWFFGQLLTARGSHTTCNEVLAVDGARVSSSPPTGVKSPFVRGKLLPVECYTDILLLEPYPLGSRTKSVEVLFDEFGMLY